MGWITEVILTTTLPRLSGLLTEMSSHRPGSCEVLEQHVYADFLASTPIEQSSLVAYRTLVSMSLRSCLLYSGFLDWGEGADVSCATIFKQAGASSLVRVLYRLFAVPSLIRMYPSTPFQPATENSHWRKRRTTARRRPERSTAAELRIASRPHRWTARFACSGPM